jgi:glycosyltransferase involved in cell wall biosynthesis
VRRFPVARERRDETFDPVANQVCFFEHTDEEERQWLEEHGPVVPELVEHLERHEKDYDAVVFFSYRYWTTYFGMQVAPHKSLLVPTAEHDRVLYLRLFRPFFRLPAAIVFNTPEERDLIERVTGNEGLPGEVVGTGINRPAAVPVDEVAPRLDLLGDYLVYVGRIEPEKGCAVMIDHFLRWQRETRATTTLALFGRSTMSFSENAHVRLMGVVPDGEKLAAIARARALVMPSRHESLSMVVLESWMMNRPVLVNGDCEVLRGQVLRANGGLYYRRYEEFAAALDLLVNEPGLADRLGRQGHAYFQENYAWERVMETYGRLLATASAGKSAAR